MKHITFSQTTSSQMQLLVKRLSLSGTNVVSQLLSQLLKASARQKVQMLDVAFCIKTVDGIAFLFGAA